jgi:uncharacterized protein
MKRTTKPGIIFYIVAISILSIYLGSTAFALDVPELKSMVNDTAGVLEPNQKEYLETILKNTENKSSCQVVVLIIESLQGENLEEFSLKVAEQGKIGQKKLDNGVLVLVALAEKKIRIEVGYGLEPILTDAKCGYIIRKLFVPQFEKGKYFDGLHDGLQAVTGLITKEYEITPEDLAKFQKEQKKNKAPHLPLGAIVFFVILFLGFIKRGGRGGGLGNAASAVLWGSMMSGSGRSSGSSFGGGGGFSGGGGSFGGGGSSGSW